MASSILLYHPFTATTNLSYSIWIMWQTKIRNVYKQTRNKCTSTVPETNTKMHISILIRMQRSDMDLTLFIIYTRSLLQQVKRYIVFKYDSDFGTRKSACCNQWVARSNHTCERDGVYSDFFRRFIFIVSQINFHRNRTM